jgi:hypothetical protein
MSGNNPCKDLPADLIDECMDSILKAPRRYGGVGIGVSPLTLLTSTYRATPGAARIPVQSSVPHHVSTINSRSSVVSANTPGMPLPAASLAPAASPHKTPPRGASQVVVRTSDGLNIVGLQNLGVCLYVHFIFCPHRPCLLLLLLLLLFFVLCISVPISTWATLCLL